MTQVRPGLLLGVNSNGDLSMPYATGTDSAAYPKSMPVHQFTPTRTPHDAYGYDYGHAPVVAPVPTLGAGCPNISNGNGNHPTWSLPNSSMRSASHGRSLSSLSGSVSAQSENGDIEIDVEDGAEDDEKGGYGRRRVLVRNGRAGMGMGIDVEGDADDMDDDDDDEHYDDHNHEGDEHHDDNDEEEDEGTETQNETYHHTRYNARFNAPMANQAKPRWDGVGMDIEMDMDMD